jgi:hypothetical protein
MALRLLGIPRRPARARPGRRSPGAGSQGLSGTCRHPAPISAGAKDRRIAVPADQQTHAKQEAL